jgi:DNA-binding TFAR19-related protein (PDSD5 family)
MSDDSTIDLLKRRKLLEMQRRLLIKKVEALKKEEEAKREKKDEVRVKPIDILKKVFVGRAWEVWGVAETQFPAVTEKLAVALARLIEEGRLKGKITGEQLYWFFRRLGLRVRLKTKIRIYESGELKTLADKLREG